MRTIVEVPDVLKKADALTGRKAQSYESIKDTLARDLPGENQHGLRGELAGKSAIDLGGSGKGRGVERVIFSVKDGVVTIHDIDNYHK